MAAAGWKLAAAINGALDDGPITGLDEPGSATMVFLDHACGVRAN